MKKQIICLGLICGAILIRGQAYEKDQEIRRKMLRNIAAENIRE